MPNTNDLLVLICGLAGSGKSASLRNMTNQDKWVYLNTESGKKLPFKNKFKSFNITNPYQVFEAFDHFTNKDTNNDGIIIDSITFLMDLFESTQVLTAADTRDAWSKYAQYFKTLMQDKVVKYPKPVIMNAHILDTYNEKSMEYVSTVPVKGSLKNTGIEAYFSTIIYAKKMPVSELENFNSPLLNITEEEKELGYKHVFQTRPTKETTGQKIRSPMGLWDKNMTYIDNDCDKLIQRLREYYS